LKLSDRWLTFEFEFRGLLILDDFQRRGFPSCVLNLPFGFQPVGRASAKQSKDIQILRLQKLKAKASTPPSTY